MSIQNEINSPEPEPWGLSTLSALIAKTRFRFNDERELQDGVEALFKANAVPYTREYILSPTNRIDFLCGRVGVEIKIKSSMPTVQRQLWRYASDDRIDALILVTTLTKHRGIAREMQKKPVFVTYLLSSIF